MPPIPLTIAPHIHPRHTEAIASDCLPKKKTPDGTSVPSGDMLTTITL